MDMNVMRGGREMKKRPINFNQITLITDGFSNQGISPVDAAYSAIRNDITVNVIGISNGRGYGEKGINEIERIAKAGGGLHQIVPLEKVGQTVQMVTRQAMNKTIQQVVHTQLTKILGQDINSLAPVKRVKVAEMVDNLAEHSDLNILLLIDQSASMISKIEKIKEAISDFHLSLISRSGKSLISILTFPGNSKTVDIKIQWTREINQINSLVNKIKINGNTPTGPALIESIKYFSDLTKRITVF